MVVYTQTSPPVDLGRVVVLAPDNRKMLVDGVVVHLSDTEALVAYEIAHHSPAIITKNNLFNTVWTGANQPKTQKIVDIIIKNVRDKMDDASAGSRHLLISEYGKGVAFIDIRG